jgi:hypothetical protein
MLVRKLIRLMHPNRLDRQTAKVCREALLGGVLVAAKVADVRPPVGDSLVAGGVIHSINGTVFQTRSVNR